MRHLDVSEFYIQGPFQGNPANFLTKHPKTGPAATCFFFGSWCGVEISLDGSGIESKQTPLSRRTAPQLQIIHQNNDLLTRCGSRLYLRTTLANTDALFLFFSAADAPFRQLGLGYSYAGWPLEARSIFILALSQGSRCGGGCPGAWTAMKSPKAGKAPLTLKWLTESWRRRLGREPLEGCRGQESGPAQHERRDGAALKRFGDSPGRSTVLVILVPCASSGFAKRLRLRSNLGLLRAGMAHARLQVRPHEGWHAGDATELPTVHADISGFGSWVQWFLNTARLFQRRPQRLLELNCHILGGCHFCGTARMIVRLCFEEDFSALLQRHGSVDCQPQGYKRRAIDYI